VPDTAVQLDRIWQPRDFEAQMLVDLLRLSRSTLLYGAQGAGKTTLLKTGVLPLLRRRAEDRNVTQSEKARVVVPFPDRRAKDAARGRSAEIAVIFDAWDDIPLAALHASIVDMLPVKSACTAGSQNLSENLATWNEELGLRFFIILDCFEQYLRAPYDRAGVAEFEYEFVRMVNQPRLAAHFLLSVRDDAEPLLNRFRDRINGFGDAFLRLPDLHRAALASVAPRAQTHRPAGTAMPRVAASETPAMASSELSMPPVMTVASSNTDLTAEWSAFLKESGKLPGPSTVSESATNYVPTSDLAFNVSTDTESIRNRDALLAESLVRAGQTLLEPEHSPTPGETEFERTAPQPREARRASAWISLAASVAGFAAGLAAGFIAIYGHHEASVGRPAAIDKGTAAEMAPAVVEPRIPVLTEVPAVSRGMQVPVAPADIEAPAAPSAKPAPARPSKPAPAVRRPIAPAPPQAALPVTRGSSAARASTAAATMPRAEKLKKVASVAIDWKTEMLHELEACRAESFLSRVACTEHVRWKHCAPDRWNTIPECGAGPPRVTLAE
jgi:Novel STAND NTPase 1